MRANPNQPLIQRIGASCSHWLIRLVSRIGKINAFELFLDIGALYFIIAANGKSAGVTGLVIYLLARMKGSLYG